MTITEQEYVPGQLTFEFDNLDTLGNMDEAMELWRAQDARMRAENDGTPPGWQYIGSGGTRIVYRAPSGVCYKICYEYDDDEDETHNELEHKNMRRIAREGRLPNNWRVPKTHLHVFESHMANWDFHSRKRKQRPCRVVILACEYVEGTPIGFSAPKSDRDEMETAFATVGLYDVGGANAVKCEDGTRYIVDAAEIMPREGK